MPVSKKPRKKGQFNRRHIAHRKIAQNKFKSPEELKRHLKTIEEEDTSIRNGADNLEWMLSLQDKDALIEPFTKSLLAIDRWPTTTDFDDFNIVSSSLMLGALCHRALNVQETEHLREIQEAAFMAVTCVRLRHKRRPLPNANLQIVRDALTTAQALIEWANDNDRTTLISVLKQNTQRYIRQHPEAIEQHERLILGKNYDRVRELELSELEDGLTLPPVQLTSKDSNGTTNS